MTLPDEDVVVIHDALVAAVQVKACAQVPLAVIVAACEAGFPWPITPLKFSAPGSAAMVQGGNTAKLTEMSCGLPPIACPMPSVPVIAIVPVYVLGVSPDSSVADTLTVAEPFAAMLPLAGLAVSHAPPKLVKADAFQLRTPPPVLLMVIV